MRVANRIASALLGLALIAAGLLAVAEAVLAYLGRPPILPLRQWYRQLTATTFADRATLLVAIGVAVLGLLILYAQAQRQPPQRVWLHDDAGTRWLFSRRALQHQIAAAVGGVTGVTAPRVRVVGKERRWAVKVRAAGRTEQRTAVQEAVRATLARLQAPAGVGVDVKLEAPRRVS